MKSDERTNSCSAHCCAESSEIWRTHQEYHWPAETLGECLGDREHRHAIRKSAAALARKDKPEFRRLHACGEHLMAVCFAEAAKWSDEIPDAMRSHLLEVAIPAPIRA
jgi:hypothetical protein